jgi:FkbM family methyltransferase
MMFRFLQRVRRSVEGTGIGRLPGVAPAYRAVFQRVRPHGITQITTKEFPLFVNADGGGLHRILLEQGVYEPDTMALMKTLVKPGMSVIDIGSNIGYFSVLCGRLIGSSGRMICVEPAPENVDLLTRNIALNGLADRTTIVPLCMGDAETTVTLHRDKTNQGNHSIAAGNIVSERDSVDVRCTTLDSLLATYAMPRVDLIKMDVQGSELRVLKGAAKTLAAHPEAKIIIEFWPFGLRNAGAEPEEVLKILRDAGYHFTDTEDPETSVDGMTNAQLVARCDAKRSGKGWMNILAER